MDPQGIGVKEYAEMMGISEKTVRRKIQNGEIITKTIQTIYGPKYLIDAEQINTAQNIIQAINVKREISKAELGLLVAKVVKEEFEERDKQMQELQQNQDNLEKEMNKVMEENRTLADELRELHSLISQLPEEKKKPFWKFWS